MGWDGYDTVQYSRTLMISPVGVEENMVSDSKQVSAECVFRCPVSVCSVSYDKNLGVTVS